MYPIQEPDYREKNADYLLQQWRDKPEIRKMMDVYGVQFNALEEEYFELIEALSITTAHDAGLDLIGKELGESRDGRNDADYRVALLLRVYLNVSSGTPKEVTKAAKLITGATKVIYSEAYPAGVQLEIIGAPSYLDKALTIRKTIPAGVDLIFNNTLDISAATTVGAAAFSQMILFESNPV